MREKLGEAIVPYVRPDAPGYARSETLIARGRCLIGMTETQEGVNSLASQEHTGEGATALDRLLRAIEALDASGDAQLPEYLVAHDKFEVIWRDEVSFLFAPAGGGKSAFRVRLAQACRAGEDGRRVFPIVYALPESVVLAKEADRPDAHLRGIARAAASELLLHLAHRPREFLELNNAERQTVRRLLKQNLPQPLEHLLDQLAPYGALDPEARLRALAQSYDPGAIWLNPPSEKSLAEFRDVLETTACPETDEARTDPLEPWLSLLLNTLHFQAIYLLVDGIDAYPETIKDPDDAFALLKPLLDQAQGWKERRLFVKAFLPMELESSVRQAFPLLTSGDNVVIILWTRNLLAELLRRRVAAAMGTEPASLDMISEPGFRGVDLQVVGAVRALPREVLAFASRMLYHMKQRTGGAGKLSREDFEAARYWYQGNRNNERL